MSTTIILSVLLLILLVTSLRSVLLSGRKRLAVFYSMCYVICFIVLILHSLDVFIYGPSYWVLDIAKALKLFKQ